MSEEVNTAIENNEATEATGDTWDRKRVAESIVNRHSVLGAGVGAVPVPLFDFAALTGVQLNMIHRLSELYGDSYSRELGKNLVLSLVGSYLPFSLRMTGVSILKAIPGFGSVAGTVAMPALAGAVTYATGQVMIRHYESGGTLLNFDAKKAKQYFREKVKEKQAAA